MPMRHEVVVVGGGPAGLSAARSAAQNGAEVLLLELQAQIGQTKTSSWIPEGILDEKFSEAKARSVEKVNLNSVHNSLKLEGNFGDIWDRSVLDKLLASEAVSAGADIWVGTPVKSLIMEEGLVKGVKCEVGDWSEEIKADVVIDATGSGGQWSNLFRREILNSNFEGYEAIQTNEYLMANSSGRGELDLYFNSFLAPGGYAWIHSMDDNFAMAGIRGKRIHPDSALDEFIGSENPLRLEDSVPIAEYRGQLPADWEISESVSDGILAVGSSVGQVYAFSGHGIKYAIESGFLAGKISAEGIDMNDVSKEKLSEYDRKWKNKFGVEMKLGKKLRKALDTSPDKKMDALLEFLKSRPKIQNDFIDIFLGVNLAGSVLDFFQTEKASKIFGRDISDEILSLYD